MKSSTFEIEFVKKSQEYHMNGETVFCLLNSLGELVHVSIQHNPEHGDVEEFFAEDEVTR